MTEMPSVGKEHKDPKKKSPMDRKHQKISLVDRNPQKYPKWIERIKKHPSVDQKSS